MKVLVFVLRHRLDEVHWNCSFFARRAAPQPNLGVGASVMTTGRGAQIRIGSPANADTRGDEDHMAPWPHMSPLIPKIPANRAVRGRSD